MRVYNFYGFDFRVFFAFFVVGGDALACHFGEAFKLAPQLGEFFFGRGGIQSLYLLATEKPPCDFFMIFS